MVIVFNTGNIFSQLRGRPGDDTSAWLIMGESNAKATVIAEQDSECFVLGMDYIVSRNWKYLLIVLIKMVIRKN